MERIFIAKLGQSSILCEGLNLLVGIFGPTYTIYNLSLRLLKQKLTLHFSNSFNCSMAVKFCR
jgi:hypothetical protein